MDKLFRMLNELLPNMEKKLYKRLNMLKEIKKYQPIGRRLLANKLNAPERTLRQVVDEMKDSDLITVQHSGMMITEKGQYLLEYFEDMASEDNQIKEKEKQLANILNIKSTHIAEGDSSDNPKGLNDVGKSVNKVLDHYLPEGENVIAVMGGKSVAAAADNLTPELSEDRDLLFISGRGGMGAESSIQSNVICDKMAQLTDGESKALYTPDQMSDEAYETLILEPSISETLKTMQQANALIFGIGEAETMISRRNFSDSLTKTLIDQKVVGEAFGEYFTASGEVVYRLKRIGLQIEDLEHIPLVIAVASGNEKSVAIEAFMKNAPYNVQLVTDEGAANKILETVN